MKDKFFLPSQSAPRKAIINGCEVLVYGCLTVEVTLGEDDAILKAEPNAVRLPGQK